MTGGLDEKMDWLAVFHRSDFVFEVTFADRLCYIFNFSVNDYRCDWMTFKSFQETKTYTNLVGSISSFYRRCT